MYTLSVDYYCHDFVSPYTAIISNNFATNHFYFEECECEFYMYMNALQGHQSDDQVLERAQLVHYEKKLRTDPDTAKVIFRPALGPNNNL